MAIDVTLRDIQSGYLTATAFTENNTLIEQALAKAIDRNGGANNEMLADLDLGLNNIINAENLDVNSITVNGTDYETVIQGIADDAQDSADAAAVSETNAANSASAASTSETNAATSEANALSSFNSFQSIYYGSFASEPATDPLGNAPTQGDLYYNSTDEILYIRDGGVWINFAETEVAAHEAKTDAHPSANITYDNTTSGLTATDVKAAIDEVDGNLDSHLSSGTAHASEDITYDNTVSGSSATDIKGAVDDVYSQIGDIGTTLDEINGEVI